MKYKSWPTVKGKIIAATKRGSMVEMAQRLDCSTEALRLAVGGRCPRVAKRLKVAINYDWDAPSNLRKGAAV